MNQLEQIERELAAQDAEYARAAADIKALPAEAMIHIAQEELDELARLATVVPPETTRAAEDYFVRA